MQEQGKQDNEQNVIYCETREQLPAVRESEPIMQSMQNNQRSKLCYQGAMQQQEAKKSLELS